MQKGKSLPNILLGSLKKDSFDKNYKLIKNLNIFTIFNNIKKIKIKYSSFVFYYIKKYIIFNNILNILPLGLMYKNYDLILNLINNSKDLLLQAQNKQINFDYFYDLKYDYFYDIIELIFEEAEKEEDEIYNKIEEEKIWYNKRLDQLYKFSKIRKKKFLYIYVYFI
jgi:hypothetical protein